MAKKTISTSQKTPLSTPSSSSSSAPAILPTQQFEDATAWETWLATNHHDTTGLWLKISKKGAPISTVGYDEAIDVALCYGWIDGQRKALDEHFFQQKFTARRKGSVWSKRNVGKAEGLIKAGRMQARGQAEIDAAKADGRWERAYASRSIEVPPEFETALQRNKKAARFFEGLNKTQRYPILLKIQTAKKPETRQRHIEKFVELLAKKKTL